MKILAPMLGLSAAALAVPAQAAVQLVTVSFEATKFTDFNNNPVEANAVSGSVSFEVDEWFSSYSVIVPVKSISLVIAGHTYLADEVGVQATWLNGYRSYWIGGRADGIGGQTGGTNDFFLSEHVNSPYADSFYYTAVGLNDFHRATDLVVSTTVAAAVPEPASWALMLVGFGALGFVMRRRPKASVAFG